MDRILNVRKVLLVSFAVVVGVISWQDIQCNKQAGAVKGQLQLPFPPRIVAAGVVFILLDMVSSIVGDAAGLVGAGIVFSMLVCTVRPPPTKPGQRCTVCCSRFTASRCEAMAATSTSQPSKPAISGKSPAIAPGVPSIPGTTPTAPPSQQPTLPGQPPGPVLPGVTNPPPQYTPTPGVPGTQQHPTGPKPVIPGATTRSIGPFRGPVI